jgi:PD-(D/E)XK nuclease superfamily
LEGDEFVSENIVSVSSLWKTRVPSERANAPEWMSFHLFKEAQRCPLAVTLKGSSYSQIWDRRGYPDRPNAAVVAGVIVHQCAETVMKGFAKAGVTSVMQPAAMSVLRELGGFTRILEAALDDYLTEQSTNPRFLQFREDLLRTLRMKLPQMRATLQELLAGCEWVPALTEKDDLKRKVLRDDQPQFYTRAPLTSGTYIEVDLQDDDAMWRGRVDVLDLDGFGCAITDLKTGPPNGDHHDQLLVYALLWSQDSGRNPSGLPIRQLRVVYTSGAITVPTPSGDELASLRESLLETSEQLRSILDSEDIPARPSPDNCRHCQVKLLCNAYWGSLPALSSGEQFSSTELTLLETRGDRAWLAEVRASAELPEKSRVILRNYEGGKAFWRELYPNLSLRITDGTLSSFEVGEIAIINLSMMSEALFLS